MICFDNEDKNLALKIGEKKLTSTHICFLLLLNQTLRQLPLIAYHLIQQKKLYPSFKEIKG